MTELDALVGDWEMAASVGGTPTGRGHTRFEWRGGFLHQLAEAEVSDETPPEWVANSPFPVSTMTGADDELGRYWMLYADGRGVRRVYGMTLAGGVWTMWREAPGFHQRFTGRFSADGGTITGGWEGSRDGVTWTPDFQVTYVKLAHDSRAEVVVG